MIITKSLIIKNIIKILIKTLIIMADKVNNHTANQTLINNSLIKSHIKANNNTRIEISLIKREENMMTSSNSLSIKRITSRIMTIVRKLNQNSSIKKLIIIEEVDISSNNKSILNLMNKQRHILSHKHSKKEAVVPIIKMMILERKKGTTNGRRNQ